MCVYLYNKHAGIHTFNDAYTGTDTYKSEYKKPNFNCIPRVREFFFHLRLFTVKNCASSDRFPIMHHNHHRRRCVTLNYVRCYVTFREHEYLYIILVRFYAYP